MAEVTPNSSRNVRCVIVTPERAVLDEFVELVVLPMFDGELGVLANRAPLIGRLGHGELRLKVTEPGHSFLDGHSYFIDGGFAQVLNNVVTVLTPRAIPSAELEHTKLEEELEAAFDAGGRMRVLAMLRITRRNQSVFS